MGDLWNYQFCTEQFMPMAKSGTEDIYWSEPWNETDMRLWCMESWGVEPRPMWGTIQWGGHSLHTLTNVVFSNGLYDPWHLGGVLQDLSHTVKVRSSCLLNPGSLFCWVKATSFRRAMWQVFGSGSPFLMGSDDGHVSRSAKKRGWDEFGPFLGLP